MRLWMSSRFLLMAFVALAAAQERAAIPVELTLAKAVEIFLQRNPAATAADQRLGVCAVKQAFHEAVYAQYLVGEARGESQYFDELLEIAQARSGVGAAPESDTIKVILERDRSRLSLAESKAQLRRSVVLLVSLLGAPASAASPDVSGNLTITPLSLDLTDLKEAALRRHPEAQGAARARMLAEVEAAFASWSAHRERVEVMESSQIGRASDLQAVAHNLYFEKKDGLTNLFEARRARREVRLKYFRALLDDHLSLARLEAAVGKNPEEISW